MPLRRPPNCGSLLGLRWFELEVYTGIDVRAAARYLFDMPKTRVFKSGNSQAVRIPAELAYADMSQELTITRMGDVITIYPAARGMAAAVALLRALPKAPPMEPMERIELPDRAWD